ncbi:ATP-dependent RNA helicase DDX51 [Portunus trituberculatus]|uniref:ATP-dependent RNA helicase n=1 Tax=Portunus trituberculatus TaxID=210409 RepID=A0A5B7F157_PORTR|nr:ATP-dependent RNA helicase DDX51 [Portunus trituberculatus]
MAPMVMLGSRDATPRRYWGEGQGPTASPSQASLLLARINSRARERKAGMGQRRLSVGLGEEQELGEGLSTPKHTNMVVQSVTPREQIEATPKDHPVDAATPVTKAELRVNGVRTEETSPDIEAMKKKKRKKKDSEGEESKGVLETSEIPESVGEDGTPIIKKKKKRKKDREELQMDDEESQSAIPETEMAEAELVQRTLPHWLAKPTLISRDLVAGSTPLDSFCGLDACLVEELKFQKVQQLFPVQKVVIPEILASAGPLSCRYRPRDLCVAAPTGSGKTLAYVLPLVQTLKSRTVPRIRVLVLLPVQELVNQVYNVFCTYCKGTPLHVGKAVGLTAMSKEQANLVENHLGCYHSLVDILVATPGRLADHLRMTQGLDLSALRYLVLDEADRMLAAEGGDWMHHIERAIVDHRARQENQLLLQPPLQRLLFSATLSSDPEHLQHVALHHPKLYTVAASAAGEADRDKSTAVVTGQFVRPAELREEFVVVEEEVKPLALHHLLVSGKGRHRVLVFTNSIKATHNLALLLAALSEGSGRVVAEFSSKSRKRHQVLSQFREGKIHVLVSSDAMARGVDIPDIDHVVCYDVTVASTYVHRIGRTARAGRPGTALSLVTKPMLREFRRALSDEGKGASQLTLSHEELEPYEQQYIDALATLKKMLEEEEREKHQKQIHIGKRKQLNRRQRVRKQKKQKLADKRRGMRKFTVNANNLRHHNEY